MAFCANCGSEIKAGDAFCGACGAPAPAGASAGTQPAAPTPPGPPEAPAATAPAYAPPAAPAAPSAYPQPSRGGGGGKVALVAALAVLGIAVVVVLLLGFAVGPKWFTGGGGDKAAVEKVVRAFHDAMQKRDARAMVALLSPDSKKSLDKLVGSYYDDGEEFLQEYLDETFPKGDLKITGLEFETSIKGDKATVDIVGGSATYTDSDGDKIKERYDDDGEVFSSDGFDLTKIGGKWYLELSVDD